MNGRLPPPTIGARVWAMYQGARRPGKVLTVNDKRGIFKMRFDEFPTSEFDYSFSYKSPAWSYINPPPPPSTPPPPKKSKKTTPPKVEKKTVGINATERTTTELALAYDPTAVDYEVIQEVLYYRTSSGRLVKSF